MGRPSLNHREHNRFRVRLRLQVPGPVRTRTKYKEHKLLTASGRITLPFVPFAGLMLTFALPQRRGAPRYVYLRVRSVEWLIAEEEFECVADEISYSMDIDHMLEVRGSPRTEQHFEDVQRDLNACGFETHTDGTAYTWALHKTASGIDLRIPAPDALPLPAQSRPFRKRWS